MPLPAATGDNATSDVAMPTNSRLNPAHMTNELARQPVSTHLQEEEKERDRVCWGGVGQTHVFERRVNQMGG